MVISIQLKINLKGVQVDKKYLWSKMNPDAGWKYRGWCKSSQHNIEILGLWSLLNYFCTISQQ